MQVRVWDVATGVNHSTLNHNKAVHCVAAAPAGGAPVAFGGAEAALRLWDPRSRGDDLVPPSPPHPPITPLVLHPPVRHLPLPLIRGGSPGRSCCVQTALGPFCYC